MKTAIVGPGAMGCLFAALLTEAGHPVWLLDRSAERARRMAQAGLRVEGLGGTRRVPASATTDPVEIGVADLVFICVKAYDTAAAARAAIPLLGAHTRVVSLQNGLGNLEAIARAAAPHQIAGGATAHGATLLEIGSIRHAGQGDTVIGRMDGRVDDGLLRLAELLSAANIQTSISRDIEAAIWSKLVVNAAINPLTALTRRPNGHLGRDPDTRRLVDLVASEAERIVSAAGIQLGYPDIRAQVYAVCEATGENNSSMLQDVLRGRRTEIDAINGALVHRARTLNVAAPVNEMLTHLVKTMERGET